MRKQDYLFNLVKSLSPAEKKYFKQHTRLMGGKKQYDKLFDAMDAMETYDHAALARKMGIATGKLAHDKEYLQQILLRLLRHFYETDSVRMSLPAMAEEVYLLQRRGLTDYAYAQCEKI